jgi:hypothetical protein
MKRTPPPHSPLRALFPLSLALLLMATLAPASTRELRYQEQTGGHSFLFFWQAESAPNVGTVTVTQRQDREVFTSVNTLEGTTLSWRYTKQPDTDVQVRRRGDRLDFSGRFQGQVVKKQEKIDARPWYQPLSFSLHCLEKRKQNRASFWTIRPDNLDVLALQAERAGGGRLSGFDGSEVLANKVVIRLEGLMSAVWSAEYWFRQEDDLFVRYRSTHGPPGISETVVTLIQP